MLLAEKKVVIENRAKTLNIKTFCDIIYPLRYENCDIKVYIFLIFVLLSFGIILFSLAMHASF